MKLHTQTALTSRITDPGGLMVERSHGTRKVVGSIPRRDIPKVVKDILCVIKLYVKVSEKNRAPLKSNSVGP